MSLSFRFSSNGDVIASRVADLGLRLAEPRKVLESFGRHMINVSVPANFEAGGRPEKWSRSDWSSEKNQMDTGRLLRSVRVELGERFIRVGSNLSYAAQRQHGGIIKAKRTWLTVPLPGVPRAMARVSRWGDRLFRPGRPGDPKRPRVLGIMSRKRFVPKFALVKQVTQPARPFVLIHDEDIVVLQRMVVTEAVRAFEAGR